MEGLRRIAAVRTRVSERADHVEELDHGARPTVAEDQREGARLGRAHVQKVGVLPVDGGRELRELVQLCLVLSPVVGRTPVLDQFLQVVQRDTAVPACAGNLAGPPDTAQPVVEVVEVGLRDLDPERPDLVVIAHQRLPSRR